MARTILTFVFFILVSAKAEVQKGLMASLEEKLENKLVVYVDNFSKWLEGVNDRHLGDSDLGRMLNYNEIKQKLNKIGNDARGMKRLSMMLLPIIFHAGAASTWMLLTALMASKSVAIGIVLLVFKIAVSSAKVASFFTAWKHKHHHKEHGWTPHYDHGHYRSIQDAGTHNEIPYLAHNPDWSPEYKSASPSYVPESYHGLNLQDRVDDKLM